jgi:DNA-binding NtrC family response regulator
MPEMPPIRLLIVDDHLSIRQMCVLVGEKMGLECREAENVEAALEGMEQNLPDLLLADLVMDRSTGLDLLAEVKRRWPLTEVALMSAYGSIESAVQAMRLGAYDFVVKPFRVEDLQRVLLHMVEKVRLMRENESLRSRLLGGAQMGFMPACTDLEELERLTMRQVFDQVGGDKERARKLLGISRATLYRKIKRYGIGTPPAAGNAVPGTLAGQRSG